MPNHLRIRLNAIMMSWPVPIEPGCARHLSDLIDKASERYEAASMGLPLDGVKSMAFPPDGAKLKEAEWNFGKLLDEMTLEAGRLGLNELHEPTFFYALQKLCPLFPFC